VVLAEKPLINPDDMELRPSSWTDPAALRSAGRVQKRYINEC